MLSDPLSVTYNSVAKSLPRTGVTKSSSTYRSADGEFEVYISKTPFTTRNGVAVASIRLTRTIPDPTPSDAFDPYRIEKNSFGISYGYDLTKNQASTDHPLLRSALLSFVDSTMYGRLLAGEM